MTTISDWGACACGQLTGCRDGARVGRTGAEGWRLEKEPLIAGESCRLVLIAPDGAKIMAQSGYHGQTPEAWLATMEKHVPAPVLAENPEDEERILSSID